MCDSKAEGGIRCPGYRALRQSQAETQVQKQIETLDQLKQRNAPAAVIERATTKVAEAQARADEAREAWLKTPAGIRHLRQIANDESLKPAERAQALVDADRYEAEHKLTLDSIHASRNRDEALNKRLEALGVPVSKRKAILAMTADNTHKHLYVAGSVKAKEQMEAVEDDLDETRKKEGREVNAVKARILKEAEAEGRTLTDEEVKAHPDYQARLMEGRIKIAQATAAVDLAKANYYASPEGMKVLKEDLKVAIETRKLSFAALEAAEDLSGQERTPEMMEYRRKAKQYLADNLQAMARQYGGKAQEAKDRYNAARRVGNTAAMSQAQADLVRIQQEYRDAQEKFAPGGPDAALDRAVKNQIRKENAPKVAEFRERAVEAALAADAAAVKVEQYGKVKAAATSNKTLRVARENAIRNAVFDARKDAVGENKAHIEAHEAVKEYRRDRKNVDRRHGGSAPVDPSLVRSWKEVVWTTEAGKKEMQAQAAAAGKPFSVWARERMLATPQDKFVKEDLGKAQAAVQITRTGKQGRPATYMEGGKAAVRKVRVDVAMSPLEKAVLSSRAAQFTETRSTIHEMELRGMDVRLVRNDRSRKNRDKKEMNGYINHPDAEKSLFNMKA